MKLSERLEAIEDGDFTSAIETARIVRALLDECEVALKSIGRHIIEDDEIAALLVVDQTLAKLRSQERADG